MRCLHEHVAPTKGGGEQWHGGTTIRIGAKEGAGGIERGRTWSIGKYRVVEENVATAIVWQDKAIPLVRGEKLDRTREERHSPRERRRG